MKTGQERPLVAADLVRRRPEMYLGRTGIEDLVCVALDTLFRPETVKPLRLVLWADDVYTVAFDGPPLPVGPYEGGACIFERCFTMMGVPVPCHAFVVNGASARLDAWTLHGSTAYLCGFVEGDRWMATRAAPPPTHARFGANGFTFRPDRSFITGGLSLEALRRTRDEAAARGGDAKPPVEIVNRMTEPCEWPMEVVWPFPPIQVLDGLQCVRLRPQLFIEEITVGSLLSRVLQEIRRDHPTVEPQLEVRAGGDVLLTLAPLSFPLDEEDPHDPFLRLTHSPYCGAWVLVNGMSERLDVRTTRDGARYACAFERGVLVEPFHRVEDADAASRLSTTLVFRPDPTIFVGG